MHGWVCEGADLFLLMTDQKLYVPGAAALYTSISLVHHKCPKQKVVWSSQDGTAKGSHVFRPPTYQIAKAWSKLSKRWCLKKSVFSQDGTAKGSHVFRPPHPPTHLPPETNSCGNWSFPQHSSQQTEGLQSSVPLPGKPHKPRTQTAQWSTHPAPALCSVPAVKSHCWWHVHQLTLLWHMSIKSHCWWHVSINSHCCHMSIRSHCWWHMSINSHCCDTCSSTHTADGTCPSNHTADDTCPSNHTADDMSIKSHCWWHMSIKSHCCWHMSIKSHCWWHMSIKSHC